MEASTIFLCFDQLIKAKWIPLSNSVKGVNQMVFYWTFAKFRIWDYFWIILWSAPFSPWPSVNTALYALFLLDCYWFSLMTRRLLHTTTARLRYGQFMQAVRASSASSAYAS